MTLADAFLHLLTPHGFFIMVAGVALGISVGVLPGITAGMLMALTLPFTYHMSSVDAVSLHCPLTPETRGLIGKEQLALLHSDAVLVNTSRGPLVHVDALVDALRTKVIRGAALDVLDQEPPQDVQRLEVPGLIVTPHMAYYSEDALQESQRKATIQVIKALSDQPLDYPVN